MFNPGDVEEEEKRQEYRGKSFLDRDLGPLGPGS